MLRRLAPGDRRDGARRSPRSRSAPGRPPRSAALLREAGFARTRARPRPRGDRARRGRPAVSAAAGRRGRGRGGRVRGCIAARRRRRLPGRHRLRPRLRPGLGRGGRRGSTRSRAARRPSPPRSCASAARARRCPSSARARARRSRALLARRRDAAAAQPGAPLPARLRAGPGHARPARASAGPLAGVPLPVLQSSANLAGGADARRLADVPAAIRDGADLVLDGGELPGHAVDRDRPPRATRRTGAWTRRARGRRGGRRRGCYGPRDDRSASPTTSSARSPTSIPRSPRRSIASSSASSARWR